jgi:hypothetical protein
MGDSQRSNAAAMGVVPGWPDYMLYGPLRMAGEDLDRPGLALEMKRRKGGKTSLEQLAILEKLRDRGWVAEIAFGADDAIAWIELCFGRRR